MSPIARLWRNVRRTRRGLIVAAWAGAVLGGMPMEVAGSTPMTAAAYASGATGGARGEAATSPAVGSECPASNPPDQMTLVAGTPQTAQPGTAFATNLQVVLSNSDGCPVTNGAAGIPVTFSAPTGGASGVFSTSASTTAIVGADASGAIAAPPFTANTTAGSYTVTASSQYGSVSFSLTNAAAGEPTTLTAGVGSMQSTLAGTPFPIRLAVTVTDAEGNPVPGVLVTFSAPVAGAGGRFAVGARRRRHRAGARRHSRHRVHGSRGRRQRAGGSHRASGSHRARGSHLHTVEVETNASGIALAPAFIANGTPGGYIVKAAAEHAGPVAFALVNEARGRS